MSVTFLCSGCFLVDDPVGRCVTGLGNNKISFACNLYVSGRILEHLAAALALVVCLNTILCAGSGLALNYSESMYMSKNGDINGLGVRGIVLAGAGLGALFGLGSFLRYYPLAPVVTCSRDGLLISAYFSLANSAVYDLVVGASVTQPGFTSFSLTAAPGV